MVEKESTSQKNIYSIKYAGIVDGNMGILSRKVNMEPYSILKDKFKSPMPIYAYKQ